MQGDSTFTSGGGGIGSGEGGGGGQGGLVGGFIGMFGGGSRKSAVSTSYYRGSGRAAARGLAQAGLLLQEITIRQQQNAAAIDAATRQAAQIPGSQKPVVINTSTPTGKLAQTVAKLVAETVPPVLRFINQRSQQRHDEKTARDVAKAQAKIAHLYATRVQPQYTAVAQYGPNYGPPVPGSADYYALGYGG